MKKLIFLLFLIMNSCFLFQDWALTTIMPQEGPQSYNMTFINYSSFTIVIYPNNQIWWSEFYLLPNQEVIVINEEHDNIMIDYLYSPNEYVKVDDLQQDNFIIIFIDN